MNWPDFLAALTNHKSIDLVGPFGQSWRAGENPVIFVDSGVQWRQPTALAASIGDGDSSSEPLDMTLHRDKEYSDLAFALRSLPQNIVEIMAHGFLGGRRDHELANFGEAFAFLKARLKPTRICWDQQAIAWSKGRWEFDRVGTFSLFSFEPTQITIEGECRYRLPEPTVLPPLSSLGLSNEASGHVRIKTSGPLLWLV
jgi:thiamine pyrophosphokinase